MRNIILASASPRRRQLLEMLGLDFEVEPSGCAEGVYPELEPLEVARRVARAKAAVVDARHEDAIVIAADTFAVLGDRILGKPHSEGEARAMLEAMSGQPHRVITGYCLIDTAAGKSLGRAVETTVYMRQLSPAEINAYVSSGEPRDKAGAYAIQGLGSVLVERIEGDYFNVIGLPLCALAESLKEFGVYVLRGGEHPPE